MGFGTTLRQHVALLALTCAGLVASCTPAQAATPQFAKTQPVKASPAQNVSRTAPVLLTANEMGYDRKNALVVAIGKVEAVQNGTTLLADRITYNQTTGEVRATGHVSIRQPDGNVYFANDVTLKDDMQAGIVQNFRARLSDNSLFAAREGQRVNKDVTKMRDAVYSPCKLCAEKKNPLWQVKAKRIRVDQQKEEVVYRNASLEFFGVPVMWTPYFKHATPGAHSKPGFLIPEYGGSTLLGNYIKTPVFYPFSSNADLTLTPMFITDEAPILFGQFRHLVDNGYYQIDGSITDPQRRDDYGNLESGNEIRGHIKALGDFDLGNDWRWGFDIYRSTDDTYLYRYNINIVDTLTSRVYLEKVKDREYASIEGLAFQGLTLQDDPATSPLVLPLASYSYESDPLWGGSRYHFDASSMILTRRKGPLSRRLSFGGGYKVPYITPGGQVFEASASARLDGYSVENVVQPNGPDYDGFTGRFTPEVALDWRYPLLKTFDNGQSLLLEPTVNLAASPSDDNFNHIPNEDSQVLEFSDINLFSTNRFPGYDRIETGPRASYGLRGQYQMRPSRTLEWLMGQSYQSNEDNAFPLTNDLVNNHSDYVGRVALDWDDWLYAAYRTRLDKDTLATLRSEVSGGLNLSPVHLNVDYLKLNDDPYLSNREDLVGSASYELTKEWTASTVVRRDIYNNQMVSADLGLGYLDECFGVFGALSRSLIRDRDVRPATSFIVRVTMKNLE